MSGVFTAETAVFIHFKPIRSILFIFRGIVVSLLAFIASKGNFYSHFGASYVASLFYIDRTVNYNFYSRKIDPSADR